MKQKFKYTILINLVIFLLLSFYNIAFAVVKETSNDGNTVTYYHTRDNENKGGIQDITNVLNTINENQSKAYHQYLCTDPSVYCVRHGVNLPNSFAGLFKIFYPSPNTMNSSSASLKNITTPHYPSGISTTNVIAYAATFSEKYLEKYRKDENPGPYAQERAQNSIWAVTGGGTYNNLWAAGKAMDEYDKQKNKELEIDSSKAETILVKESDIEYFKVGPFKMNNYAFVYSDRVKRYSNEDGIIGGIVGGSIKLEGNSQKTIPFSDLNSKCKIVYGKGNNGQEITGNNSVISYLTSYVEGTNDCTKSINNYSYPKPNSEFYILLERAEYEQYNKISMNFSYRKTNVQGEGWVIADYVTDAINGYTANIQPLLVVENASVSVTNTDVTTEDVRLTTDVSIDKYIYNVEHISSDTLTDSGLDTTSISNSDGRKEKTNEQKKENSVYVEYGDIVTYHIDLKNNQDCDVNVRVRDEFPENLERLISAKNISNNNQDLNLTVHNTAFLTSLEDLILIRGNSTVTLEVKFLVNSLEGTKVNRAILSTNNAGEMKYADGSGNGRYRGTIETTSGKAVVNINSSDKTYYGFFDNNHLPPISEEYYTLNDYNVSINKYISSYTAKGTRINNDDVTTKTYYKITEENNSESLIVDSSKPENTKDRYVRYGYSESEKFDYPMAVDKGDELFYSLMVTNNSEDRTSEFAGGVKKATQVRPSVITDTIQYGLKLDLSQEVYAEIYDASGNKKANVSVTVGTPITTGDNLTNSNVYTFSINEDTILNPGEYMVYYIPVTIEESNMYLGLLENKAEFTKLTNINHNKNYSEFSKKLKERNKITIDYRADENQTNNSITNISRIIKDTSTQIDRNFGQETSSEFVRMKDLVIAGRVWLDKNRDGYMNYDSELNNFKSSINVDSNPSSNFDDSEKAIEGIVVRLYQRNPDTNEVVNIRTVKTNNQGIYTFGYTENSNSEWRLGTYSIDRINGNLQSIDSDQRIIKATMKNSNTQKYDLENSKAYNYYIEFEYDGIVFKSTEVYSGALHLNDDGSMNTEDLYKRDSNAREFKSVRDAFNLSHEIVGYNYAADGNNANKINLEYEKNGHNSYLKYDKSRIITARSFVENTSANTEEEKLKGTKLLWLYQFSNSDYKKPETDYLKYINLGLTEREGADISVVQDVYEVKNTINGEEMTYWYNQNEYAKDGSDLDHDTSSIQAFTTKEFMTGFKDNNSALAPYEFKYYLADYNYKFEQYTIKTVQDYKTKDSELNSEITFRIKVTNNANQVDEQHLEDSKKDIKVYTGINEVIEYFDNNFMNIYYNEDGTVKTLNIKTKDENGYLVDKQLKIAEAYFVLPDGNTIPAKLEGKIAETPLTLSDSSVYNKDTSESIPGYNTVYIRPNTEGINKVILAEGENVDIIIKFVVDKDENSRNLKLGLHTAIAEIGAYSTYYKNTDNTYYAAGLVDKDSNPGNFGKSYNGISFNANTNNKEKDPYLALYEDDTFKTGINLELQQNNERQIEGQVWDDARSNEVKKQSGEDTVDGIQYIGDGKNGTVDGIENNEANSNAKINTILGQKEKNDFKVNDVGVKLVEFVKIPIKDASGGIYEERVYEETIKVNDDNNSIIETRTGENNTGEGKYILKGYIPGEYGVRFLYGDNESDQMCIFNGQDYKSTTYQSGSMYAENAFLGEQTNALGNKKIDTDKALEILEKPGLSDAKDDEIRRLETISYSETLNNNKTLILRGLNSISKEIQTEKTSMNADTVDFLVRAEKEKKDKTTLTYSETINKFIENERHPIENIDFGLQYRPEQQVGLNKYVKNLTITTADDQEIVNAKFNEYYGVVSNTNLNTGITQFVTYEDDYGNDVILHVSKNATVSEIDDAINSIKSSGKTVNGIGQKNQDGNYQVIIAGTELDTKNSIGINNLQFMPNEKDVHDLESIQGFVYLNIDDKIMQGSEIKVQYLFTGHNLSEIDRVNKNLSKLRFVGNLTGDDREYYAPNYQNYNAIENDIRRLTSGTLVEDNISLITRINADGENEIYSGALTARNDLFNKYYRYEIDSNQPNKDRLGNDIIYRIKSKTIGDTLNDYYGSYLGTAYYTGKASNSDIVAELKIDKILDYVDNNMVFKEEDNDANSIDNYWSKISLSELVLGGYILPDLLQFEDSTNKKIISFEDIVQALKDNNIDINEAMVNAVRLLQKYSSKSKLTGSINLNPEKDFVKEVLESRISITEEQYINLLNKGLILDSEGVSYNTDERSNLAILQDLRTNDLQNENKDSENFVVNADITKYLIPRNASSLAENPRDSYGTVKIFTSKVISAEDETKDMSYENVGEVVEYSSVTGRITNINTTLGNVNLSAESENSNSPEFEQGRKKESDTAAVEKITLTPPTGLSRTSRVIKKAVKGASYVGIIIIIAVIAIFGTLGGFKLYRKRKIK